ncbi:MAG: branched-chain amino acid ABC transporter ATP-binding protein/permease [Sporichthyaceae bacterium]
MSDQVLVSPRTRPVRATMLRFGPLAVAAFALGWVFAAPDYMIFTASAGIPLAIAGLGLLVLQGWARELSLATAGLFGTALYYFGYLNRPDNYGQGLPWVPALLVAVGLVALLMVAVAALSVRLPGIYLVVITLGVQIVLEKTVFTQGRFSGGFSAGTELGVITNPRPYVFGINLRPDTAMYFFLLAWLAVVVLLIVRLRHSPAGRAFLLVGVGLVGGALIGPRGLGGAWTDLRERLLGDTDREHLAKATAMDRAAVMGVHATVARWVGEPAASDHPALAVRDVRVAIDGLAVLDGVSLEVPAGGFVGLIGPNGAGKSTLFDVIGGVRPPNTGSIHLFGTDISTMAAWRRAETGMTRVFQSTRVIDDLSVADNLVLGAHHRIGGNPARYLAGARSAWNRAAEAEDAARAIARLLNIEQYWYHRVGTLSFSGKRRVEIGRALLASPRLLLLDEPAAGMDPYSQAAMFDLLRTLHAELALTVLLVEHNVTAVLETCDLVHVLAAGRLLASGSPAEIVANETVRADYLGNRLRFTAREATGPAAPAPGGTKTC